MHSPTHLLVANPVAQSGRNAARIQRALRAFEMHGIQAEYLPTQPEGQTISAVRDALNHRVYQCVVSMGGDGTLREVAQGLWESERRETVTLGMLPAGTANNHGRSFGLDVSPAALENNVAVLARGKITQLDVGRLEMHDASTQMVASAIFIDSVGFGIGARVITRRERERHRFGENTWRGKVYRDKRVYTAATLQALWFAERADEFGVTIVADGQTIAYPRLTELLVKGTRVYAGSWIIDPTSKHDDGLFEVVAYPKNRQWVLKGLVDVLLPNRRTLPGAGIELPSPWRAARLRMHFQVPQGSLWPAVQVDGELFPAAEHVNIEVLPRALRLVVP